MQRIVTQQHVVLDKEKVPPDGGYGWIIVIAYALANLIVIPTTTCFGLIFKDKFEAMNVPAADLTMIININSAFAMSLGFINGPLLRAFGYRKVSVVGGAFFAIGMMLTSMADTVPQFIITYGLITAVGYGLTNTSFSLALNAFFHMKRNRAAGIAMTLTGIGPIVYPPIIHYLLQVYNVNGCALIIGALALNLLVAAALLQPIKKHMIYTSTLEYEVFEMRKNESYIRDTKRGNYTHLPVVSTFHSIGKFSESSFVQKYGSQFGFTTADLGSNAIDRSSTGSRFSIDHDIETQSIYGLEQIAHLQPSIGMPRQEAIARNFSRRTLCENPNSSFISRNNLRDAENAHGLNCSQQNFGSAQSQQRPEKRWFESGSTESIHLGSSQDIFRESMQHNSKRRRSSIFSPFRRQSLLMQTIRKNLLSSTSKNRLDDPKIFEMQPVHEKAAIEPTEHQLPLPFSSVEATPDDALELAKKEEIEYATKKDEKVNGCACIAQYFDFDLLKDKIYLNMMIGMSIAIFAEQNFAFLTPFILSDLNFTSGEIASILSMIALTDIVSRFLSPFIADYLKLSVRVTYLISLVFLIMTRMTILLASNYTNMLIIAGVMGIAKGIRSVYITLVIPSYIPIDRLAAASGFQMFVNGVMMISMGPVLGLIKDFTGSYLQCILFLNFATFITVTMYSIEMTYTYFYSKDDCDNENDKYINSS